MKGIPLISMRHALADPRYFGAMPSMALHDQSWDAWCVIATAAFPDPNEPLDAAERSVFTRLTGKTTPPTQSPRRIVARVGRRGGKDAFLSLVTAYIAGCIDWRPILKRPGELGTFLVLANSKEQARVSHQGISGVFAESPALRKLVTGETADSITLAGRRVQIVIRAAESASLRGYSLIGVGLSEFAFFQVKEHLAETDAEIVRALEPGLLTSGGPLLMCSSPGVAEGVFFEVATTGWGDDGPSDTVVVKAASFDTNPTLHSDPEQRAALEADEKRDPIAYRSEILAEWRDARSAFISRDLLTPMIEHGTRFWEPDPTRTNYVAACDFASGIAKSNGDAAACVISYYDRTLRKIVIANCLHIQPPFDALNAVMQVLDFVQPYNITRIYGDKRFMGFCEGAFMRASGGGLIFTSEDVKPKASNYLSLLPRLTGQELILPDVPLLINELCGLSRRMTPSGEQISALAPLHDDLSDCLALAVAKTEETANTMDYSAWNNVPLPGDDRGDYAGLGRFIYGGRWH